MTQIFHVITILGFKNEQKLETNGNVWGIQHTRDLALKKDWSVHAQAF